MKLVHDGVNMKYRNFVFSSLIYFIRSCLWLIGWYEACRCFCSTISVFAVIDIHIFLAQRRPSTFDENRVIQMKLSSIIQKHYDLLDLVTQTSDIFAAVILVHFLSDILTISINSILILLVKWCLITKLVARDLFTGRFLL